MRSKTPLMMGAFAGLFLAACGGGDVDSASDASPRAVEVTGEPSPYLYVWARDLDEGPEDTDFLAVIDADPGSAAFGQVLATAPVGATGTGAHHAEPVAPSRGLLFANGFASGRTFLFDLSDPAAPSLAAELEEVPGFDLPHSFLRLENGEVLATLQVGDGTVEGDPGALARFDAEGRLLRVSSAADPAFPGARIMPYSLEVLPTLDRVLTTSRSMSTLRAQAADLVQVWRLSDLELLATLPVPRIAPASLPECILGTGEFCDPAQYAGEAQPFEIRALPDGSALLNTFACGFYRISGLVGEDPGIEEVLNWPEQIGCSVPSVMGDFFVLPVMMARAVVVLDVSDPSAPTEVHRFETPEMMPHWSAADPGANRVVITPDGPVSPPVVVLLELDPATGRLSLDGLFGAAGASPDGVSFDRQQWPHGSNGPAKPHAALFGVRR